MDPNQIELDYLRNLLGSMSNSTPPNIQSALPNLSNPLYLNSQMNQPASSHLFLPYQYPMHPPPSPHTNLVINTQPVQSFDKDLETPMRSIDDSEDPPFRTQDGLEVFNLDEGNKGSTSKARKHRDRFSIEEDKLLVESYFDVSEDPIFGVNQKSGCFWARVASRYNKFLNNKTKAKNMNQVKSRHHRLQAMTSKFVRCYKLALESETSGSNNEDIMEKAMIVYHQDHREKFTIEHVWRLVKDNPRWFNTPEGEGSSKRTKISASGAYTSSPNQSTPSSEDDLERPFGHKATKGKEKLTKDTTSTPKVDALNEFKVEYLKMAKKKLAFKEEKERKRMALEDEKLRIKEYEIFFKDTSRMTEIQKRAHEKVCRVIRKKIGI